MTSDQALNGAGEEMPATDSWKERIWTSPTTCRATTWSCG